MASRRHFIDYLDDTCEYRMVSNDSQANIRECPFCGDTRWKVYIGMKNMLGDCKVCSRKFHAFTFVSESEGIDWGEVDSFLTGDDVTTYHELIKEPKKEEKKVEDKILLPACKIDLNNNYLLTRGLTSDIISTLDLRYAERGMYKDRIIIPIKDIDGSIISYQGRDVTGLAENKYLFPIGFQKSHYLYNCNNIRKNPQYLIVAEGVFDCIGWMKAGFDNVVGTFGKTISDTQVDIIRHIAPKKVYMGWDYGALGDMQNVYKEFNHYFDFEFILMDEDKDADESTKEELQSKFTNSITYDPATFAVELMKGR